MSTLTIRRDLEDAQAFIGRRVQVNVQASFLGSPSLGVRTTGIARARQQLAGLLNDARTSVAVFPTGTGADFTVTGTLHVTWESVWNIRSVAWSLVEGGAAAAGLQVGGFGPEDVAVLDLDADAEERVMAPDNAWYDGGAGTTPDGQVDYSEVVAVGAGEGLRNAGTFLGKAARAVGEGAGGLVGGLFSGLGTGGTIVVLLVLALLAILALAWVFGGPALLFGGA